MCVHVSVCLYVSLSQCQMVNTQLQSWTLLFCCCQTTSSRPCFRFWTHFWRSAWEDMLPSVRQTKIHKTNIYFQEEAVKKLSTCEIMSSDQYDLDDRTKSCVFVIMCNCSLTVHFLLLHVSQGISFFLCLCVCVCAGGQQLAVSDADTAPDELEFELVDAPLHGELIKTDGNTHVSMTNGEMMNTCAAKTSDKL